MFTFGEKLSQVPPVPEDHGVTPPPRESPLRLVLLLYIINALEEEGAAVFPFERPAYLAQPFACLSAVCCLSYIYHLPQLGFQDKLVQDARVSLFHSVVNKI
jgi:hypothetical protein